MTEADLAQQRSRTFRNRLISHALVFAAGVGGMAWAFSQYSPAVNPVAPVASAPVTDAKQPNRAWLVPGNPTHALLSNVRNALLSGATIAPFEALLRERFLQTQPDELAAIAQAASNPVSARKLAEELGVLTPQFLGRDPDAPFSSKISRFFEHLVILRASQDPSPISTVGIDRARIVMELGQPEEAIALLKAMPGHELALPKAWLANAQRLSTALSAIDRLAQAPEPVGKAIVLPSLAPPPVMPPAILPQPVPPSIAPTPLPTPSVLPETVGVQR